MGEIIGEHYQQKIALTKAGTPGVDAITEEIRIISIKNMQGQSVSSNLSKLTDNINEAIHKYKPVKPLNTDLKVEIWVKGDYATTSQALERWNIIKDVNVLITENTNFVGKIFYKGPDGIIELTW